MNHKKVSPQSIKAKNKQKNFSLNWGSTDVAYKGADGKYFRFAGHVVSVAGSQRCHYSMKTAIDNI